MVAQALLDTTFFIDFQRGENGAAQVWNQIISGQLTAAFASVTVYELWLNENMTSADELFYAAMFSLLEDAPLTAGAAAQTAEWLRAFPRRVRDRRLRDAFIAAIAAERHEVVYTRNIRDLRRYGVSVHRY